MPSPKKKQPASVLSITQKNKTTAIIKSLDNGHGYLRSNNKMPENTRFNNGYIKPKKHDPL